MFTPGFRLFFGLGIAGLLATVLYAVGTGDGGGVDYFGFIDAEAWIGALSLGWKGGVGDHVGYVVLVLFSLSAMFLGSLLVAFRDADPESVAELHGGELPPSDRPTPPNYWPVVGAFGVGVTIIGLVVHAAIFVAGLLILVAVAFEWMMSAWADRATGDPQVNAELRHRIMGPIEIPVIGTLGLAAIALAVSRVFLAVSKEAAVWVGVAVTAIVFVVAVAFAMVDKVNKNLVAAVLTVGAIGCLTAGVIAAAAGEREFEHHGEHHDEGESVEEGALAGR